MEKSLIYFIETHPWEMMFCTGNNIDRFSHLVKRKIWKVLDVISIWTFVKLPHSERSVKIKRMLDWHSF